MKSLLSLALSLSILHSVSTICSYDFSKRHLAHKTQAKQSWRKSKSWKTQQVLALSDLMRRTMS